MNAHLALARSDARAPARGAGKLATVVLLLFVTSQLLAGVLRWLLGKVGLAPLIYLPTALLWGQVAWIALQRIVRNDLSMSALALAATLLLGVLVGCLSLDAKQAIFGAWVLTPLVYGYAVGGELEMSRPAMRIAAVVALCAACLGVFADNAFACPWVGANFELAGKEITGSRDWNIGEHRRLAGFSRSSFDAAGQITVFAVLINADLRTRLLRWSVWALAIVAVGYTTARGVLVSMFVAMAVIESPRALQRAAAIGATVVGLLWMSLPPLLAWTVDFGQSARLLLKASYGSYLDRMANMWPDALQLLAGAPLPPFGRGIGGIGAAQTLFEPARFNAADNLLVYQCVALGAFALPIIAVFMLGACRRATRWPDHAPLAALGLIAIWYGAVSNIVEHPILAIVYGLTLRQAFSSLSAHPTTLRSIPS